jgi:cytochrome d ubiquinol oxidase subunit II
MLRAQRRNPAKRREGEMEWYLPVIWAALIGAAVALYVILDGFDLGIGILFPFAREDREKNQMIDTIAPFWDGNETWLVLGGGGLWVAFPRAYAVVMPALYLPVIVMLLALVFRGVAFEFRTVAVTSKKYWNFAFAGGSTLAAFCQGLILGGLIQGIKVENGQFAGGAFDFLTPFALLCGLGVVTGYALLGACWLTMKTEGEVAARARAHAKTLLIAVLVFMAIVSLWTPYAFPRIRERWFSLPNILYLWPVPAITGFVALMCWRWLEQGRDVPPFLAAIVLFMLGYIGLAISVAPYLVPHSITIFDAAAAPASQIFMLLGTLPLLPIILIYTGFVYYVFRGKVKEGEGYH